VNLKLPKTSHGRFWGWRMPIFDIWEVSLEWNSQFLIHTWTFLAIIFVASQLFLCLCWISLWLTNRCLQHPCFKNLCKIAQASKNSYSNAQHFLSDLLTHSWFHSMLFALPSYQFPYIAMNRCLYLMWAHHFEFVTFKQTKNGKERKGTPSQSDFIRDPKLTWQLYNKDSNDTLQIYEQLFH
jgi:hypothetical protein